MKAPAPGVAAFDRDRLSDVVQGSAVAAAEFLAEFRRTTDIDAANLLGAATADEPAGVIQSAHRIEGACRMIGAADLADACSAVSAAAASGNARAIGNALIVFTASRDRLYAFIEASDASGAGRSDAAAGPDDGGQLCSGVVFVVVEDHEFQRGMIVRTLKRFGAAAVHDFAGGADALDAVRNLPSGAILMLDLGLATLTGIDIARIAGAEQLAVSIILLSAQPEEVLLSQTASARACGVTVLGAIGKPLTVIKLAPLVARYRHLVAALTARPPASP